MPFENQGKTCDRYSVTNKEKQQLSKSALYYHRHYRYLILHVHFNHTMRGKEYH